jgi:hypothetical protein
MRQHCILGMHLFITFQHDSILCLHKLLKILPISFNAWQPCGAKNFCYNKKSQAFAVLLIQPLASNTKACHMCSLFLSNLCSSHGPTDRQCLLRDPVILETTKQVFHPIGSKNPITAYVIRKMSRSFIMHKPHCMLCCPRYLLQQLR